jgi:hypothetical protein
MSVIDGRDVDFQEQFMRLALVSDLAAKIYAGTFADPNDTSTPEEAVVCARQILAAADGSLTAEPHLRLAYESKKPRG